jgi:hypothetical protein
MKTRQTTRPGPMSLRKITRRGLTTKETVALVAFLLALCLLVFQVRFFQRKKEQRRGYFQVQHIAVGLAQSISQFKMEYGRWPSDGGEMHKSDADFLDHLEGQDKRLNTRGINFLKDIPEAKGKRKVCGLKRVGDAAEVVDLWSRHFLVFVDHDENGNVTNPEGPVPGGGTHIYLKVAVISAGPDGMLTGINQEGKDATLDNIRSW